MWPIWAYRIMRTYAPAITLPFAAIVGYLGYVVEGKLSNRYTPYNDAIQESRSERLLSDEKLDVATNVEKLKYSANVLGRNVSPSLQDKT